MCLASSKAQPCAGASQRCCSPSKAPAAAAQPKSPRQQAFSHCCSTCCMQLGKPKSPISPLKAFCDEVGWQNTAHAEVLSAVWPWCCPLLPERPFREVRGWVSPPSPWVWAFHSPSAPLDGPRYLKTGVVHWWPLPGHLYISTRGKPREFGDTNNIVHVPCYGPNPGFLLDPLHEQNSSQSPKGCFHVKIIDFVCAAKGTPSSCSSSQPIHPHKKGFMVTPEAGLQNTNKQTDSFMLFWVSFMAFLVFTQWNIQCDYII